MRAACGPGSSPIPERITTGFGLVALGLGVACGPRIPPVPGGASKATDHTPAQARAAVIRSSLYAQAGDFDAARRALSAAALYDPGEPALAVAACVLAAREGDTEARRRRCPSAAAASDHPQAWSETARLRWADGDSRGGADAWLSALAAGGDAEALVASLAEGRATWSADPAVVVDVEAAIPSLGGGGSHGALLQAEAWQLVGASSRAAGLLAPQVGRFSTPEHRRQAAEFLLAVAPTDPGALAAPALLAAILTLRDAPESVEAWVRLGESAALAGDAPRVVAAVGWLKSHKLPVDGTLEAYHRRALSLLRPSAAGGPRGAGEGGAVALGRRTGLIGSGYTGDRQESVALADVEADILSLLEQRPDDLQARVDLARVRGMAGAPEAARSAIQALAAEHPDALGVMVAIPLIQGVPGSPVSAWMAP